MPNYIYSIALYDSNELYHHGIKGQRWGIRRFQNPDGTLKEAGLKRIKKNRARITKAKTKAKKYEARAASQRVRANAYELRRDASRGRRFQTDISIARANKMERRRARANMRSLKYDTRAKRLQYKASKWKSENKELLALPVGSI